LGASGLCGLSGLIAEGLSCIVVAGELSDADVDVPSIFSFSGVEKAYPRMPNPEPSLAIELVLVLALGTDIHV
jgi:hypothetical protein